MKSIKRLISVFNKQQYTYHMYIVSVSKGNICFGVIAKDSRTLFHYNVHSVEEFFTWFVEWVND